MLCPSILHDIFHNTCNIVLGVYERQIGLIVQLQAISLAFILAGVVDRKNLLNIVVDTLIVLEQLMP